MYEFVKATDAPQTKTATIQTVFDGVNLDEVLTDSTGEFRTTKVLGRSNYRARLSPVEIPGRAGTQLAESVQDAGELKIFFKVKDQTSRGLQRRLDRLRGMLTGIDRPVMFTDEDSVYYGTLESLEIPDEVSNDVTGEFTLYRADPLKYGTEYSMPINPEGTVIQNRGTATARPIFTFNVTEHSTMIEIASEDDYMAIGRPLSVEQSPHNPREMILYDQLQSLVGWGQSPVVPEVGVKSGVMISNGEEFMANDYGVGNAYHGPVMQRTHAPMSDFEVMVHFNVKSTSGKQRGRAEAYLLSDTGTPLGKIMVVCPTPTSKASVLVQLRNGIKARTVANRPEFYPGGFFGFVRVSKKGTDFSVEIVQEGHRGSQVITVNTYRQAFRDLHLEYQQSLVGIALHVAAYGTHDPLAAARLRAVRIYKLSEDKGIPYIVQPGDEVIIDHIREEILINGETRTDLKDFGGNYFPLKPGENILMFNPPGSFAGTVNWRERYR